ncbi:MAG: Flap endonuclease Xni [marine bacterium B5-7]|nr:MAG: Flap endonuclease Xni [marine bacterium B5-7]
MNVLLVDGLNLIRRVHAALDRDETGLDKTRLLDACESSIRKLLSRQKPSHAMGVVDSDLSSWRHQEFPEYKANRKPMPDSLARALPAIIERFGQVGVQTFQEDGFEADDVIAAIATRIVDSGGRVTIASTDTSFCQLLSERLKVYDHFSERYLDLRYVRKKLDVTPEQLPTLFALTGNPSVNVPGVRSIGVRTAAKLIHDFGDLDTILDAAEEMKGHIGTKLRSGREDARRAYRLLSLKRDIEVGLNLKDFRLSQAG